MQLRVTQNLISNSAKNRVRQSYSRLFESQLQVSRGKRISTPSDDPSSISRLLFFRERLGELNQFEKNASESRAFVESASSTLQEASDIIQQARSSVIQGLTGTLSQTDRDTVAIALDGFIEDLVSLANSRVGNRFVFGGTETSSPPYELYTDTSSQTRVRYNGNDGRITAEIGPGVRSSINVPGSKVFERSGRGATNLLGDTGAKVGAGTDSGIGVDKLIVAQTGTTLGGASGLTLGTSSSATDTIIGTHNLQVDDVAQTISLNGGPPVSYTGSETNLKVKGPNGEVVSLATGGITPGFVGPETATGSGTLSTDGGATTQAIDFSGNQQVIDSISGQTLNIDSSAIRFAGTEDVSFSGTLNLFQSLVAIRDSLRDLGNKGDLVAGQDAIRGFVDELDASHDLLLEGLGELGSISNRLTSSESRVQDMDVRLQELISKIEDVDISDAIIQLQQEETSYQSALLVTSRINNLSLLNFF